MYKDELLNMFLPNKGTAPTIATVIKEQLPPGEEQAKAVARLMYLLGHRRKPIRGTG